MTDRRNKMYSVNADIQTGTYIIRNHFTKVKHKSLILEF